MASVSPDPIEADQFRRLHPLAITDFASIDRILNQALDERIPLTRGTNSSVQREIATLRLVSRSELVLDCVGFGPIANVLFLSMELKGVPYFFSAEVVPSEEELESSRVVRLSPPGVLYRAERRDRVRMEPEGKLWVKLALEGGTETRAEVVDTSGDGLGVLVRGGAESYEMKTVRVQRTEKREAEFAVMRNRRPAGDRKGWTRLGLSVLPGSPSSKRDVVQARDRIENLGGVSIGEDESLLLETPDIVEFSNSSGESIVGILDTVGRVQGGPVVLIPSAWGKTKETLSPLAATILSTFSAAGLAVSVLRFDGVRKRGESHTDPGCDKPELGNLHYTFSQGADDLFSAAKFMSDRRSAGPAVIVSFSVASVEARRAMAQDDSDLFSGWVSIVGATDPQSLIRVISGGVDYLGGAERGIKFGRQDVQGLLLDIDRTAKEALSSRIAFLEDARRDFQQIVKPVTWISGKDDAWTDPERILDVLSFGPNDKRRHFEAATGHQLRSSAEAIEIFGLAASECARIALGAIDVRPVSCEPKSLKARQRRERSRLRQVDESPNLRGFWKSYLVGRDGGIGMEMVTETESHRRLMLDQLEALRVFEGAIVVDLGSGLGTFSKSLLRSRAAVLGLHVIPVDLVFEGVLRGRDSLPEDAPFRSSSVVADLSFLRPSVGFPLQAHSVDRVVASLLLNYILRPDQFLSAVFELLKPGGRVVMSVLREDADTSKICVDGIAELRGGRALSSFGHDGEKEVEPALGEFINDAARLLDFEERGIFRFWSQSNLVAAFENTGFKGVEVAESFGLPPQAWLIAASRPT